MQIGKFQFLTLLTKQNALVRPAKSIFQNNLLKEFKIKALSIPMPKSLILDKLKTELELVLVHVINLISNLLGNDFISCRFRCLLFRSLGAKIGAKNVIRGGGYIYGYKLTTGANCQINRNCYFDFTGSITFGDDVVVGHGVTFITSHHEIASATRRAGAVLGIPIVVKNGVWIGANATILPGVVIAEGAVVAAGAVVTKSVPANAVVAGVPAKLLRSL